ncbi:MAG: hypothetical protein CME07_02610 [Gemmatimonadetes bacterium]|nr:hypothetical protein [Gemmatimonadota bacterium]
MIDRNLPPETFIVQGPDESADPDNPDSYYYRAHLYWRGEDPDGTVDGFRFAMDDTSEAEMWHWTALTDSVFLFQVDDVGSRAHTFFIRSVDNGNKQDATPDTVRFLAFTTDTPEVIFLPESFKVNGVPRVFNDGDTMEVFSDMEISWTGTDADGEVVSWTSQVNAEDVHEHDRFDTTLAREDLTPGTHTVVVNAVDDAGAVSDTPARFLVHSNFDPVTTIDRSSIVYRLARPWLNDTLETYYEDGFGGIQDTIPMGGTMSFCWSSTDVDGPVVDYVWNFQGTGLPTVETCDSLVPSIPSTSADPRSFTVSGRDIYGQMETPLDVIPLHVNYRPSVTITAATHTDPADTNAVMVPTSSIEIGQPAWFLFEGDDLDSDPDSLTYRWRFSFDPSFSQAVLMDPDSLFIEHVFTSGNLGTALLIIQTLDPSLERRPSEPDSLEFQVVSGLIRESSPVSGQIREGERR